jgi:hypothetical protein
MILTYLRSSSIGTYAMCPQKYLFTYLLGMKDKDNGKAIMGSTMHKNLELLGKQKIAQQNKKRSFVDEEFGKINFSKCSIEYFNELSHSYYEKLFPGIMPKNSKKITLEWTHLAVTKMDGEMNPLNQNVHAVEEFFEVEVPHEWANYSYKVGDEVIEGRLGLKGTVDLILKEDDVFFHVVDYKSGRRYNWATDTVKTYDCLSEDKQLLLYYYALRLKYPDKHFYISIYYTNDYTIDKVFVPGGVFTFAFDDKDFKKAELMIREQFETIRDDKFPRVISKTCNHFKCKYLCAFSQIIPEISADVPACIFIRSEIERIGLDTVTEKYADLSRMKVYSGGGRQDVDLNPKD